MSLQANEDCQHPSESTCNCGLPPHQLRVLAEKFDLDIKISKLRTFFMGVIYPTLPVSERQLLHDQLQVMEEYSDILGKRINSFKS